MTIGGHRERGRAEANVARMGVIEVLGWRGPARFASRATMPRSRLRSSVAPFLFGNSTHFCPEVTVSMRPEVAAPDDVVCQVGVLKTRSLNFYYCGEEVVNSLILPLTSVEECDNTINIGAALLGHPS